MCCDSRKIDVRGFFVCNCQGIASGVPVDVGIRAKITGRILPTLSWRLYCHVTFATVTAHRAGESLALLVLLLLLYGRQGDVTMLFRSLLL